MLVVKTIDVLKAVADETRLRMLSLLDESEDLCGCEIEAVLGINQSNASRHLTRLRSAGVIHASKRGQWVHYALHPPEPHAELVRRVIEVARSEDERFTRDLHRMQDYRESPYSCQDIWKWVELHDGLPGTSRTEAAKANAPETS
jgi:ArsR family transcriptional regulator